MTGRDSAVPIGSGDGRGKVVGVRDGLGDGVGAGVEVGAAVAGGGDTGESLPAPEHAAVAMMSKTGANRGETTRTRLETRITYSKLYHSVARPRCSNLMCIHRVLRPGRFE